MLSFFADESTLKEFDWFHQFDVPDVQVEHSVVSGWERSHLNSM